MSSPASIKPCISYYSDCLPPICSRHWLRLEGIWCNTTQTHLALQVHASEILSSTASAVLRCKSPQQADLTFLWHQCDGVLVSLASALGQNFISHKILCVSLSWRQIQVNSDSPNYSHEQQRQAAVLSDIDRGIRLLLMAATMTICMGDAK